MNPLILVGLDLAVSAALILLAMYVVWSRVQSRMESLGGRQDGAAVKPLHTAPESKEEVRTADEEPAGEWAFGGITEQAASLRKKGCSTEQIAHRLQLPTREVEMVLAISDMGNTGNRGREMHVPFSLDPDTARAV
jgi:hypothetical protein